MLVHVALAHGGHQFNFVVCRFAGSNELLQSFLGGLGNEGKGALDVLDSLARKSVFVFFDGLALDAQLLAEVALEFVVLVRHFTLTVKKN